MFVPSAVAAPATSTHFPELVTTRRARPPPRLSTRIDCASVPLHVHSWMFVPSALPLPLTSKHLPGLAIAPKLYVPAANGSVAASAPSPSYPLPHPNAVARSAAHTSPWTFLIAASVGRSQHRLFQSTPRCGVIREIRRAAP